MAGGAEGRDVIPDFSAKFQKDFETLLKWRRDVRRFKQEPLPAGALDHLLQLADLAPSVGNSQPWRIVVVDSAEARGRIIASFEAENEEAARTYSDDKALAYRQLKLAGLKEAPVHLAIFCDDDPEQGHGLGRLTMPETLAYSTVSMIHTFWLAARAEGVGVGWVSILDPDAVTEALQVDAGWRLVAYLCVGYPEEEHIDPELERARWQARTPLASRVIHR
ncbi:MULTISPECIES: 5,6-dimethylbenzimidazole synthase [Stappiaceae]|jgi:5,6-dimethylbenzimidazole synthase|uniref:5,6-dimethylbenzimidazole synthase n=1 Tax=Stappiaceae TaxID=2821832 RepID=UPI0003B8F481|nr:MULTISPECIES: 5,6-dimethylbenzimidazole synthase [Stappiaceae]ERP98609.1 cob(II)yrinic acid a,c-diamide reductase [Labrenzia sp. C1B10]ERR00115.1 cob(II)yrinic acid a,c-diamide reductase [Labrenzia sp. C1B70]NKI57543.1 5,6-dimethylbenzimidazole synthase [Labrenzia sp. PO1]NKX65326.1 5,6-dimethylbenzimidazole synthase [Labrenzia sp. 5N]UFI03081.1 5,6-dimethylbenzimidazole synthase [Roseibium aggregatum]